jgi:uncharacterized membrane protein YkvA (DUF1232 family)
MIVKAFEGLRLRAKALKKEVTAIFYAYRNPEVRLLPKMIIAFTLCYALSPIDLIPDFIPVIGYLDDLIIIPALISLSLRLIPKSVMEEARRKAESEPLELKKNWGVAVIFILIWIVLLTAIVVSVVRLSEK